jgi:tetratricopeptide (TPR) repeat protein
MPAIEELERRAAAFSRRGDPESAQRVCREILARDKNHLSSLRFLADLALQAGDFAAAETHLHALIANSPGDPQLHSQLGQVLYRQGKLQQAVAAYEQYWRLNPRKGMIYLTLGSLHLELGNIDKAVQVFSLGEAVDPNILSLWKNPDTKPALAQMSKTAWDALCRHHTELHIRTVEGLGDGPQLARIRDAVWPLVDTREVSCEHPQHRPQVFCIKYAEAPAFFEPAAFPWREQLEGQYADIREEILAGLDLAADGRPYLGAGHRLEGAQWEPLVNRMSWASVHLYSRGVANQRVIGKFPRTLAALAQVPVATSGGNPAEVFISVLAPHTRIPEHYGVSSAILTAHLPLEVPPGCGLKVHEEVRVPEAGKLMVFDDTWEHSAWNNSDRQRVVLIFEVWHPDLTEPEQEAVLRSFQAREQWLRQRRVD